MGPHLEKTTFSGSLTTKVQTSLHIHEDLSVPLLFAFWKVHVSYLN